MVDDFTKSDSLGRGNWLHTTSPRSNFSDKYHCRKRFRLYQNKKEPSHRGPNSLEESNLVFIHSREPRLGLWHAKAKKTLFGGIRFLQKNLDRIHSGEPWGSTSLKQKRTLFWGWNCFNRGLLAVHIIKRDSFGVLPHQGTLHEICLHQNKGETSLGNNKTKYNYQMVASELIQPNITKLDTITKLKLLNQLKQKHPSF